MNPRYSWTQACCVPCWNEHNPDRPANPDHPYDQGEDETCVHCGQATVSGIYVRVDPKTAAFPTTLKD